MSQIKEIIPDIHGYTRQGQEIGGEIAKVETDRGVIFVRFDCNYRSASACPLRDGIKKFLCDAANFQRKGIQKVLWESPGFTVGCGRTDNIKENPPERLRELFPNHTFPPPPYRPHRKGPMPKKRT